MKNEKLENLRHSAAHLLAAAVMKLWPDTKHAIGPVIDDGFYYDFELAKPLSEADLPKIEETMKEIVKSWKGFERHEVSADEARTEYKGNPYKRELIDEFAGEGQKLTIYQSGEFRDLCRGGHCPHPNNDLKHFKLMSLAGAYWRGNEKNTMLTRIYGTAFPTKKDLDEYLTMREEAKKRDHRKLGQELELFTFSDLVGKGLPLWLPKGTIIRNEIEKLAIEMEDKFEYLRVSTPHVAKEELYLTSGHLPYYKNSMYPPMVMDDGTYYLKSMNCPHHHIIYLDKPRSYRDLPLRLAEYGTVYRNELSGTLAGLLRVRMLSMNDAHIYCTADQVEQEVTRVIELTAYYYQLFGLKDYWFRLSLWSPEHKEKYIDEPENWKHAQDVMRKILKKLNLPFEEAEDEAAFYGPKLDVQFKSVIGREESLSTIQLDFLAKSRFKLSYIDAHGKENGQVFVIHRAPLSVHERFMAFVIEHYAGAFPAWLAPIQVRIAAVGKDHQAYCHELAVLLKTMHIRADVDDDNETVGNKIRKASNEKIPYTLVVGDKELQSAKLAVRIRGEQKVVEIDKGKFVENLKKKIKSRSSDLLF
ncbi:MAG: threonine--tRNA ligase [Candidatus Komeilibacteria bacterium]|nr:threonine--tRNA ligase [Candidatus Komeilibacteria bacterium]